MIKPINIDLLRNTFEYRDGGLYYIKTGKLAGDINRGRLRILFCGSRYGAHRLIYACHFGEITEGMYIDHIDGNPLNNRIENLRLANHTQNAQNRRQPNYDNKLGILGVYKTGNRLNPYRSSIRINRKKTCLGSFPTPEEASNAYQEARKKHFGDFA